MWGEAIAGMVPAGAGDLHIETPPRQLSFGSWCHCRARFALPIERDVSIPLLRSRRCACCIRPSLNIDIDIYRLDYRAGWSVILCAGQIFCDDSKFLLSSYCWTWSTVSLSMAPDHDREGDIGNSQHNCFGEHFYRIREVR